MPTDSSSDPDARKEPGQSTQLVLLEMQNFCSSAYGLFGPPGGSFCGTYSVVVVSFSVGRVCVSPGAHDCGVSGCHLAVGTLPGVLLFRMGIGTPPQYSPFYGPVSQSDPAYGPHPCSRAMGCRFNRRIALCEAN